jgi:hypothetical protein
MKSKLNLLFKLLVISQLFIFQNTLAIELNNSNMPKQRFIQIVLAHSVTEKTLEFGISEISKSL